MARILSIVPYHALYPPDNGGALRCFYLLRELARFHEVHAIILQPEEALRQPQNGYQFPASVRVYGPCQTPPPRTFFDWLPGHLGSALHYRWLRRSWRGPAQSLLLQTYHILRSILTEHLIDIVIYEHLTATVVASTVRHLSPNTTGILDAHNIDHLLLQQKLGQTTSQDPQYASLKRLAKQTFWTESHLDEMVEAFFACSADDLDLLTRLNDNKVTGFAIPNGIETAMNPLDNRTDKQYGRKILFCGSLHWLPNQDGLEWFYREIWPLICSQSPETRLMVIGRGAAVDDFQVLHHDPRVDFVGAVDDVRPYYNCASLAIVPLRMGSGTRLKILEAMSLGTPVVSTTLGAQGLEVVDGKHLLLADEPEQFGKSIERLLTNPTLFEDIRFSARALVEQKYDWQVIGRMMNQSIDFILDSVLIPSRPENPLKF